MADEKIDMSRARNVAIAEALASRAAPATMFGEVPGEQAASLAERTSTEVTTQWVAWFVDGDGEEWVTAVTGNGSKSRANAEFYASARASVLGLVDRVRELEARVASLEEGSRELREAVTPVVRIAEVLPRVIPGTPRITDAGVAIADGPGYDERCVTFEDIRSIARVARHLASAEVGEAPTPSDE